jgi:hypothetical protein
MTHLDDTEDYSSPFLPAEGWPLTGQSSPPKDDSGVTPMGYTDRLMQDVTGTKGEPVPVDKLPTERLTFRVARHLQDYPRKELTLKDIAAHTGLTVVQVSSVTQRFVKERTDVTRPRRGVVVYTPGQGPGIKKRAGKKKVERPSSHIPFYAPPTEQGLDEFAFGPGPVQPVVTDLSQAGVMGQLSQAGVMEQPEMAAVPPVVYTAVPGLRTADGRFVVQDRDGVVYAVAALI